MSPRKIGLGKGLESLIPLAEEEKAAAEQGILEVSHESISPNPHQPRSQIRDQDLLELAASIEEHGIIQPLVVTKTPYGYQLIAGERRWRAARVAGLTTVPVLVKDAAPNEMLELALVENIQRSDLNALEEAIAYQQLVEEFGLTQREVAQRVGKSRATVANILRLLKAARPVQEALLGDRISEGHARALLGLEEVKAQKSALKTVLERELNVRQTEALVRRLVGRDKKRPPELPDEHEQSSETRALEARFREALGTKVNLKRSGDGGHIVIYFYSEEEFKALYEYIVGNE
jgi:ParB family chromosome partitioning protein